MIRNNQVNGFYYTSNSHPTIEKIYDFQKLEKGWSYGEGIPFQESILDDAVSLIKEAIKFAFYTTDAFPGLDGEIMCTVYYHEHYLEFIIESDRSVTFSREKDGEEICYQEGLLLQDAKDKIKGFWQETWNTTSESSIQSIIMTHDLEGSTAWRSVAHQEYLLSESAVPSNRLEQFAHILKNIISPSQLARQSSDASQEIFYLATAS